MRTVDNNILKQIGILIAIIFIGVVILWKLAYFIPGFLGAAAIYIMFRSWYFKVIARRGWKPWLASLTIIVGLLVAFVLPAFLLGQALAPKFNDLIANSDQVKESILKTFAYLQEKFPQITITREQILAYAQRALGFVPSIFNGMAHLFANIFTALFIAYFMFVGGRQLEQGVKKNMPLERASRQKPRILLFPMRWVYLF
jgi:predicted PurR-regulated permease PerM